MEQPIHELASHLFRENAGKMVTVLSQRYGYQHVDLAMDIVQDSFEASLHHWKYKGIPDNPSAWLMKVAIHKMLNALKKQKHVLEREILFSVGAEEDFSINEEEVRDSQLNLLLFLCRLDISQRNRTILTLYYLCGFGYPEVANAMLMAEEAVKKVIIRNKMALKAFRPGYDYYSGHFTSSLPAVRQVLYLLFNEGYKTTRKASGINKDLCYEAMRLGKLVLTSVADGSMHGLLALLFFNVSRFPARLEQQQDSYPEWVTLEEQDRSLWDSALIAEGFYHLGIAKRLLASPDAFYLEALISSLHCSAATFDATQWDKIVLIYTQLEMLRPDSMLYKLNRIIAESQLSVEGRLEALDDMALLFKGPLLYSFYLCKAYLYGKLGDRVQSVKFYESALGMARSEIDKRFIEKRIRHELSSKGI